MLLSACTPVPSLDASGHAGEDSGDETVHADLEEPVPAEPAAQEAGPAESEEADERDADPDAGEVPEVEEIVAGTIELSIESGGVERVFRYEAEHCFVSSEYILAGGTGSEVGTGLASEVGISSTPAELLHESTGTFQADGLISVRSEEGEVVTDGRMITVGEGSPIPSMFTYSHDDNSAHYVVAWFSGAAEAGAGYVKLNCDY